VLGKSNSEVMQIEYQGKKYAMKIIIGDSNQGKQEAEIFRQLNHRNITKFKHSFEDSNGVVGYCELLSHFLGLYYHGTDGQNTWRYDRR
jgi:hypothetical protein